MSNVVPFKPSFRPSRETELWNAYLWAHQQLQDEYPNFSIESVRAVAKAWDDYTAEVDRVDRGGAA